MMLNDTTRIRGGVTPQMVATGQGIAWPWDGGVGTSFGHRAQDVMAILQDLRRLYVQETAVEKTRNMLRQGPRRERFEDWAIGMKGKFRVSAFGDKKAGWVGPATVVDLDPEKQNTHWKHGGSLVWKSFAESMPLPVGPDGLVDARARGSRVTCSINWDIICNRELGSARGDINAGVARVIIEFYRELQKQDHLYQLPH